MSDADGGTLSLPHSNLQRVGLAENRPGHKPFLEYKLPKWVQHPIKDAAQDINVLPEDYMHGAGDGVWNQYNNSPAHVAALFGDISLLKGTGLQALSLPNAEGELPAHTAVRAGTSWVVQYLVDMGADVTSQNRDGKSPEDLVYDIKDMDDEEKTWIFSALDGKLSEKESVKAQEFRIKKDRPQGIAKEIEDIVNRPEWFLKLRKFHYGTVDWDDLDEVKFKPPPLEESLAKRDLPRADFSQLQAIKQIAKPSLPCALLFPGDGSQYIGMMKDAVNHTAVQELVEKATEVLGWDVQKLALEGPEDKLSDPFYCQPLLFVACMAGLELFRDKHKEQFERLQCTAGQSIGEYSALVAAGVLEFEDSLRLVKLRAEALGSSVNATPQSMCTVAGLPRKKLEGLCYEALLHDKDEGATCQITNSLFPSGFTVGGTRDAVNSLIKLAKEEKALQAREFKSGGGYQTPLMRSAEGALGKALDEMLPRMKPPRCAIYFNRTGRKVSRGTDPHRFLRYLKEQVTNEVLWETSVKSMLSDGVRDFFEVGPLKQLKAMMKRIDQEAFERTTNITV